MKYVKPELSILDVDKRDVIVMSLGPSSENIVDDKDWEEGGSW